MSHGDDLVADAAHGLLALQSLLQGCLGLLAAQGDADTGTQPLEEPDCPRVNWSHRRSWSCNSPTVSSPTRRGTSATDSYPSPLQRLRVRPWRSFSLVDLSRSVVQLLQKPPPSVKKGRVGLVRPHRILPHMHSSTGSPASSRTSCPVSSCPCHPQDDHQAQLLEQLPFDDQRIPPPHPEPQQPGPGQQQRQGTGWSTKRGAAPS